MCHFRMVGILLALSNQIQLDGPTELFGRSSSPKVEENEHYFIGLNYDL
jgi:hypothetical protein